MVPKGGVLEMEGLGEEAALSVGILVSLPLTLADIDTVGVLEDWMLWEEKKEEVLANDEVTEPPVEVMVEDLQALVVPVEVRDPVEVIVRTEEGDAGPAVSVEAPDAVREGGKEGLADALLEARGVRDKEALPVPLSLPREELVEEALGRGDAESLVFSESVGTPLCVPLPSAVTVVEPVGVGAALCDPDAVPPCD